MAFLVWHRWGPGLEAASLYFFNNLAAAMGVLKGLYYWDHANVFAMLSINLETTTGGTSMTRNYSRYEMGTPSK